MNASFYFIIFYKITVKLFRNKSYTKLLQYLTQFYSKFRAKYFDNMQIVRPLGIGGRQMEHKVEPMS